MAEQYLTIPHLSLKNITRIFSKIQVAPEIKWNGSPCWIWTDYLNRRGYGLCSLNGNRYMAHRVFYAWLVESLPGRWSKLELDHLCRRPACVNPAHLELVTHAENCLRGASPLAQFARQTHCKNGHLLSGDNVYSSPTKGGRICRTCHTAYAKQYKQDHKDYFRAATRRSWLKHKDRYNERKRKTRTTKSSG